jgi:hypothetical protein
MTTNALSTSFSASDNLRLHVFGWDGVNNVSSVNGDGTGDAFTTVVRRNNDDNAGSASFTVESKTSSNLSEPSLSVTKNGLTAYVAVHIAIKGVAVAPAPELYVGPPVIRGIGPQSSLNVGCNSPAAMNKHIDTQPGDLMIVFFRVQGTISSVTFVG